MEKFIQSVKNFVRCEASDGGVTLIAVVGMLLKIIFAYYMHYYITSTSMHNLKYYTKIHWGKDYYNEQEDMMMDSSRANANVMIHFSISLFLLIGVFMDTLVISSVTTRQNAWLIPEIMFYSVTFFGIFIYYLVAFTSSSAFNGIAFLAILINGHFLLTLCSYYYQLRAENLKAPATLQNEGNGALTALQNQGVGASLILRSEGNGDQDSFQNVIIHEVV